MSACNTMGKADTIGHRLLTGLLRPKLTSVCTPVPGAAVTGRAQAIIDSLDAVLAGIGIE